MKFDEMNYYQKRYMGSLIVELMWEEMQTWNIPMMKSFFQDFIE